MKKLSLLTLLCSAQLAMTAQSWAPNNANSISAVNQQHAVAPMTVGIGTSSPSAVLHSVGTLRLEGLTLNNSLSKILVQDNSGNVFLRDASTIGSSSNNWNLLGNANTNPNDNFIGTVDLRRLVFRTNNLEQATILENGNMGLGTNSPTNRLVVHSTSADNHIKVSGTAPSIQFGSWNARIGLSSQAGDFSQYSQVGDLSINNATNNIILSTGVNGHLDGLERMRITQNGYLGIATRTPTAGFHIDCTGPNLPSLSPSNVRLEHLPTGRGDRLLIDRDGYVFREAPLPIAEKPVLDEIEELRKEVESLKSSLKEIKASMEEARIRNNNPKTNERNTLQIVPNPHSDRAKAIYHLDEVVDQAFLYVLDPNGQVLRKVMLNEPSGEIEIGNISESSMIIFNLVANGKIVASEKSIKIKN